MKKICLAVAVLSLSSCGSYHKDGTSWAQTYDDYVGCNKEAQNQERALESQCMAKLGYENSQTIPAKQPK
ncbi:hypothetical protein EPA93_03900 [Ktedonosporobacter rubrisoli]|uniref:EexN family lipoprotein n=1 Tax=Ktedonosporobacter rubrisoli TaxID=2509675 RepID=A0A4P6JJR4_KTERU|nr:hypothetical protein [Ktedonosporobacter rubrisoli]QBD75180.1 hypothetical protein EPA93_03900 [Ktedonosporobacter rubrisoli]